MKKAINSWSFFEGNEIDKMKLAKKLGFYGYEPAFNLDGFLSCESSDVQISEIKKAAEDIGITLTSLASGLYWHYSFTSNDGQLREKAKDIAKRQLNAAAVLKVDTILVVPGVVNGNVSYDVAYDRALEEISLLKTDAEQLKINIGIENVWNKFLLSPLEMRDFIDMINSEYVGVYFDIGNVLINGYPEQWIDILGKRIRKLHVKDYKNTVTNESGFVSLLDGNVDFTAVMNSIHKVGLDGYMIAEISTKNEDEIKKISLAFDKFLN